MKSLIALTLLTSSFAFGQTTSFFTINRTALTNTNPGLFNSSVIDTALTALENEASTELSNIDPGNYLKYSTESTIVSGKANGSDYANNFSYFIVGAGLGVGVNLGSTSLSEFTSGDTETDDANGAGLQTSLMAGVNLAGILPEALKWGKDKWWGADRFSVFFNFFKYEIEQDELTADALALGFKVRWLAMKPRSIVGFNLLKWEGLHVHFGLEKSNLDLNAEEAINLSQNTGVTGSFNSTARINAEIDTLSVPLEVSSAIRFLYLFTLYGGLGLDLNSGSGSGSASLDDSTVTLTSGADSATFAASAFLGNEQEPDSFFQRYFAGLQFNIWKAKMYFQYDRIIGENTHGIGLGLRVSI